MGRIAIVFWFLVCGQLFILVSSQSPEYYPCSVDSDCQSGSCKTRLCDPGSSILASQSLNPRYFAKSSGFTWPKTRIKATLSANQNSPLQFSRSRCFLNTADCNAASDCCSDICNSGKCDCTGLFLPPCLSHAQCCDGNCVSLICSAPLCTVNAGACSSNAGCCSGKCYTPAGICVTQCAPDALPCLLDSECCNGNCLAGTCAPPCTMDGVACNADSDCCGSSTCPAKTNVCTPPCADDGNVCQTKHDCCDGAQKCKKPQKLCNGICSTNSCSAGSGSNRPNGSPCKRNNQCMCGKCKKPKDKRCGKKCPQCV